MNTYCERTAEANYSVLRGRIHRKLRYRSQTGNGRNIYDNTALATRIFSHLLDSQQSATNYGCLRNTVRLLFQNYTINCIIVHLLIT